jgi:hypothetical protein
MTDITEMQEHTQKRHREVLDIVEAFSDATSSDGASSVRKIHCFCGMPIIVLQISRFYSGSHNRLVCHPSLSIIWSDFVS